MSTSTTPDRPIKYEREKKYLGSFFADNFLINYDFVRTFVKGKSGSVPARPEKYHNTINRILQAFDVLIGKADALYWHESFSDYTDNGLIEKK